MKLAKTISRWSSPRLVSIIIGALTLRKRLFAWLLNRLTKKTLLADTEPEFGVTEVEMQVTLVVNSIQLCSPHR